MKQKNKQFDDFLSESRIFSIFYIKKVISLEIKKQISMILCEKMNEISTSIMSFYITNFSMPDTSPPNQIQNALIPPPKISRILPSTAPNKIAEEIKNIMQNCISDILHEITKNENIQKHNKIQGNDIQLQNENIKLKNQLEKITKEYYKELNALREQIYQKNASKKSTKSLNLIRYFKIEDGLSAEICELMNTKIKEIKDLVEEKMQFYQETNLFLSGELKKYELLSPQDYPLIKMNLAELFSKIKKLYSGKTDIIWEGLKNGFEAEFIANLVDEKYGRASEIPYEIIKKEFEKLKIEITDIVKGHNFELQSKINNLEQKVWDYERKLTLLKYETAKNILDKTKPEIQQMNDLLIDAKQDIMFLLNEKRQAQFSYDKLKSELDLLKSKYDQNEILKFDFDTIENRNKKDKISLLQTAVLIILKNKLINDILNTENSYNKTQSEFGIKFDIEIQTNLNDIHREICYKHELDEQKNKQEIIEKSLPKIEKLDKQTQTNKILENTIIQNIQTSNQEPIQIKQNQTNCEYENKESVRKIYSTAPILNPISAQEASPTSKNKIILIEEADSMPETGKMNNQLIVKATYKSQNITQKDFYKSNENNQNSRNRSLFSANSCNQIDQNSMNNNEIMLKKKKISGYLNYNNNSPIKHNSKISRNSGIHYAVQTAEKSLKSHYALRPEARIRKKSDFQNDTNFEQHNSIVDLNKSFLPNKIEKRNITPLAMNSSGKILANNIRMSITPNAVELGTEENTEKLIGLISKKSKCITFQSMKSYIKKGKQQQKFQIPKNKKNIEISQKSIKQFKYEVPLNITSVGFTNERIKKINKIPKCICPPQDWPKNTSDT